MVPTAPPVSMLELPSSGSNSTTYGRSPSWLRRSTMGSSFSSLATIATPARVPRQRNSVSFAMTSSFCWVSPCTFSLSSVPNTLWMRARRTLALITRPENDSADKIHDRVPEAFGCRACSARMWACRFVRFSPRVSGSASSSVRGSLMIEQHPATLRARRPPAGRWTSSNRHRRRRHCGTTAGSSA